MDLKEKAYGHRSRGITLIEVVVGIGLIAIVVVAATEYFARALLVSDLTTQRIQSSFLIEEGINTVKMFRNSGWNANIRTLSTTTTYYLYWSGTTWTATTTPQYVENLFLRSFVVEDVKRDNSTYDISTSTGTYTTSTKRIVFTNTWSYHETTTTDTVETYVSNLFSN